ncbi:MAG TPA: PH domain-containing protein [Verrucomicrobiae bacterium]|nr:PH domain-containing protein [Verrucomicrobiae bacterium]
MAKGQAKAPQQTKIKYFPDQFDDEEVLYVFRKHPIVMRKGLIWGSLGLLVGPLYTLVLTYANSSNPPTLTFFYLSFLVSLVLAGILFFPSWMSWYYSVFIVSDQRFIQITQKGFFHRSVVDMGLNQIQMINYEISGLQETLLGFGTIMMQTFVGDLVIHYLHHPQKIQKHLLEILREHGVSVSDAPTMQTE